MALSLFDVETMSSTEFRKKIDSDPAFRAEVEALYANPKAAPTGVDPTPVEAAAAPTPEPEPVVPPAPVAPAVLPEQRYEWQPTDENGRPIGGRQVIKYRTEQEKFDRVVEQNTLLIRQLRKVNKERVLGIEDTVPSDGSAEFEKRIEFKPRDLTAQQRFDISQKIQNPETFAEGRDQLIESALGVKPAELAKTLNETQQFITQQRAVDNYIDFINTNGVYDCLENRTNLTGWMRKLGLAPTVANFNLALAKCRSLGLVIDAPAVRQEPVPTPAPVEEPVVPVETVANPQPPVAAPTRISAEPQPQAKRHSHVPSGLNASIASAAGPVPVGGSSMTLAEIDNMSADEYKKRSKDPSFVKLVNQLEQEAAQRRRAKALGQA